MPQRYDLKKIKVLLTEVFTDEELRRFCYDTFPPVYKQLDQDTTKSQVINRLIRYADRKSQLKTLLACTGEYNPTLYEKHQPYNELTTSPTQSGSVNTRLQGATTPPNLIQNTLPSLVEQRVQIYLQGDFSSLSRERRSAAIEAFAAVMGISPKAIKVYRVEEGSIVFYLGIPSNAVQRLHSLLQSNSIQLHRLKIEKVILEREAGEDEEWIVREGKFELITTTEKIEKGILEREAGEDEASLTEIRVGKDEFTAKLYNMSEDLLYFVKTNLDTFIKWDLVRFFHENPHIRDTAENIAKYAGRSLSATGPELEELKANGILERVLVDDQVIYFLTEDEVIRNLIDRFILACEDRHFRVKVAHYIR